MGRKKKGGGGMRGFLKTAKNTQDAGASSESESELPETSTGEAPRMKAETVDLETETKAQLRERHQKEMKVAKLEAAKLGKKKKQEAAALLESVKERHEQELQRLKTRLQSTSDDEEQEEGVRDDPVDAKTDAATVTVGKKSKSKKRREKEAQRLEEREERIRQGIEDSGVTERENEERLLKECLENTGYEMFEIRPDGHCLYGSVADQLDLVDHQPPLRVEQLRTLTAEELRFNAKDYLPFFVAEGDAIEEEFMEYCRKVEETAEWGGEMEVEALSKALHKRVVIVSVGLGETVVGEEFAGDPLRICFMQHAFHLGAHYNSIRRKELSPL